jgi:hypothetical protein
MRWVQRPDDHSSPTRWDRATQVEITADSRDDAIAGGLRQLGHAAPNQHWVFHVDGVTDGP